MDIRILKKGEKVVGPVNAIEKNADGWAHITAPSDGMCFCLNAAERNTAGFFLGLDELEKMLNKFRKDQKVAKAKKRKTNDSQK